MEWAEATLENASGKDASPLLEDLVESLCGRLPHLRDRLQHVQGADKRLEIALQAMDEELNELRKGVGPENVPMDFQIATGLPRRWIPGVELRGGRQLDRRRLWRAFAILLDLLSEADDPLLPAKPESVHQYAAEFSRVMEDFANARRRAGHWVMVRQLQPRFEGLYAKWKKVWPKKRTPVAEGQRIPEHPSTDERAALKQQEKDLYEEARSVGLDVNDPEVRRRLLECRASPAHFTIAEIGPKNMAARAVGELMGTVEDGLAGHTLLRTSRSHAPVEAIAHQTNFKFFVPDEVQAIVLDDVLAIEDAARASRTYYARYLVDEEAKRLGNETSAEDDADEGLQARTARENLGIPAETVLSVDRRPITGVELALWRGPVGEPLPAAVRTSGKPLKIPSTLVVAQASRKARKSQ